ncbi:hypothetical protein [Paenibacillus tepidiphilus]|uniref:hypothetical protein n=1 Tax=Paenibacillus tepidiphilus TaxID=2608683 RepID=UPI00123BED99|nr:hypothetical protein [Paenibacillus tepidiphilus]
MISIPVMQVTRDEGKSFVSTSKGDQLKWRTENQWAKVNKFGYEGLAEWAAYEIIKRSNIPPQFIVPYSRCLIREADGTEYRGCYSEDFLQPDESLISLHRLLESYGISIDAVLRNQSTRDAVLSIIEFLRTAIRLDTLEYFSMMLPLDAFLLNEDRHLNNIAFIHGPGGYRLCPYFDHGLSLLSDTTDYPLSMPIDVAMRRVKAKPFSKDFSKQARALETNLRFDRSSVLQFIEEHEEELGRIAKVLKLQMRKYEYLFV